MLRGTMRAHTDIVTASRDKSIILWHLTKDKKTYGVPRSRLTGHSHFVQDVVLSSDSQFALSGSWDGELHLWDLVVGVGDSSATLRMFSLLLSELRLCRFLAVQSSYGTIWVSVSTQLLMVRLIAIGSAALDSALTISSPQLFRPRGIVRSRFGTSRTAS